MSKYLDQDYKKFTKEIGKSSKPLFKIEGNVEPIFRKHHKSVYCIALILTKLETKSLPDNKTVFLAEIVSDLLIVSKLSFLGFESSALILLRRIIENFYNHIYYSDHPIEYEHLNLGKNDYTPIDKLKLYFETHPVFFGTEDVNLKEFNQLLFNEYQQLCKIVHSKGKESLNLAKCLKDLTENYEIDQLLKQTINIELYIVYLSYKFHKDLQFTATEKEIITSIVPLNKRVYLNT